MNELDSKRFRRLQAREEPFQRPRAYAAAVAKTTETITSKELSAEQLHALIKVLESQERNAASGDSVEIARINAGASTQNAETEWNTKDRMSEREWDARLEMNYMDNQASVINENTRNATLERIMKWTCVTMAGAVVAPYIVPEVMRRLPELFLASTVLDLSGVKRLIQRVASEHQSGTTSPEPAAQLLPPRRVLSITEARERQEQRRLSAPPGWSQKPDGWTDDNK